MRDRYRTLGALFLGYVGIYLCRKNFSVANPMLQEAFGASKAYVGTIASAGTIAYAAGKILLGPVTDRIGGRAAFLAAIAGVTLFGGLGGLGTGIGFLIVIYSVNRFCGAGGWMSMMKTVPTWYPPEKATLPITFLNLSYVVGGLVATLVAQQLIFGGWRLVMGGPALITAAIFFVCLVYVRPGPLAAATTQSDRGTLTLALELLLQPRFAVILALSFTMTFLRETFNVWAVDFLKEVGGASVGVAALQSIGFDLAGAAGIIGMGLAYDRVPAEARGRLVAAIMAVLAVVIAVLPVAARTSPLLGTALVAAVGGLVYGPYSLLAGVLAVESGGPRVAATATGLVDGIGYLGSALAGAGLGALLDWAGYSFAFPLLAGVSGVTAILALFLRPHKAP